MALISIKLFNILSSGSYLLNEEKGAKKKAILSMQALIKGGSVIH